ncbi:MAG: tRNA lysidine(34) synthetase TilS, partial [Chloroflexota bacterium]
IAAGSASTAAWALATRARMAGSVERFVVGHVDHRTRPETAAEQGHVAALCRELGCPFVALDVCETTLDHRGSREDVLRRLRYEALAKAAARLGLTDVVTAHTRDDQIETVIMRLMSGTSSLGATGMETSMTMETKSGAIVIRRPLLDVSRKQLEEVIRTAGIEVIEDPSNEDLSYRRNAIRHRVVPALRAIDPGFGASLLRSVEMAARDARVVDTLARQKMESIVQRHGSRIVIARHELNELEPALSSRIVREAILELRPDLGRDLPFERVEAVRVASLVSQSGAVVELPGSLQALIRYGSIELEERE